MKKEYTKPTAEIIDFAPEDAIMTSLETPDASLGTDDGFFD